MSGAMLVLWAVAAATAPPAGLTMDEAVSLALTRNHDAIAARLQLSSQEFDRVQAGLYPNPVFTWSMQNGILATPNDQGGTAGNLHAFSQVVNSFSIQEIVDVWAKRNTRLRAANQSIEHARLMLADALRDIVHQIRGGFAEALRERSEYDLAVEVRQRYDETIRLSRARFAAGDISERDFKKVELEGMRFKNNEIEAQLQLDLARQKLAMLLAMPPGGLAGAALVDPPDMERKPLEAKPLIDRALANRPDVRAAVQAKLLTAAALAQARREAFPDISVGFTYTHSMFTIAGDNPDTFGLMLSLPLPIFDRNQAAIGRARVDIKRAENEAQRLVLAVGHEVSDAVRRTRRNDELLDMFEGGMLARATSALEVAERAYRAGAMSLLELLEAQRTFLDIRAQYLRAHYDYRQAVIDVRHAVGEER